MGFVYRVRDKEKNRVFIGYRTSIPFSRLRGQIMSEMLNEDYVPWATKRTRTTKDH